MSYMTLDDMIERFGSDIMSDLTGLNENDLTIPTDAMAQQVLQPTIDDVAADIDSRLAASYDLPLPAGNYPLLTAAACDLARFQLYDQAPPEIVKQRAMNAGTRLKQLVDGHRDLINIDGVRIARRQTAQVQEPSSTDDDTPPSRRMETAAIRRFF